MARAASLDAGINFETSVKSFDSGSNTSAVLQAIKLWESARNHGAFTAEEKKLLADGSTYWHLRGRQAGRRAATRQGPCPRFHHPAAAERPTQQAVRVQGDLQHAPDRPLRDHLRAAPGRP